jgi:Flp pilus assembly pilin Flp
MFKIKSFFTDEDGAVTVDWVVLTAAIAGLVVLIASAMQDGALGLADSLALYMSNWSFS